jgi:hypothetical protein
MAEAGSSRLGRLLPVLACLAGFAAGSRAAELPPAQGTLLHFQKTLSIQTTARGRVFSEIRRAEAGDTLAGILTRDYGVAREALPALTEAFRAINPRLDPNHLPAGRPVRIPFKLEESPAPAAPAASSEKTYTVRRGESLWRILKNRFKILREAMPRALQAVARANPALRNLDHLEEGQRLVIPESVSSSAAPSPAPAAPPAWARTVFALLTELGCGVSTSGETFLPLARGRTIRLDGRDFPVVTGPGGRRVVLDPASRLSVALTRDIGEAWGYSVLQGTDSDPEAALAKLLPRLGFHEVAEGPRTIPLAPGVELTARPRWTLVARPEDPWEGRVHLLFRGDTPLDPDLSALALAAGFSLHSLGGEPAAGPRGPTQQEPEPVPEISFAEPGRAEGALLGALGIPHQVRPDVECDLGGGVRYHLRPDLTFTHDGTAYAVPPREPRRAEALLARAGYFTVSLPDPSAPFDRLRDLLALLRIRSERVTLRRPRDQGLELSVEGLSFDAPEAARLLYPKSEVKPAEVLLTQARVPPLAARALLREGLAPWVVRLPKGSNAEESP